MATLRIAIIGGGAAGFFAAVRAKELRPDAEVIVYEKNARPLAKVAITGGGRCNLTNSFGRVSDLKQVYPRGYRLMKRLLCHFDHCDCQSWFEHRGVPLVTQADECVFPQSQDAMTIVGCLLAEARRLGVRLVTSCRVESLLPLTDGRLRLGFRDGRSEEFDRVAVTTGGSPRGEGLHWLAALGHEIAEPVPSLFTFNIADRQFTGLMGTVVAAAVSIPGSKFRAAGPLLITHWGMSGPAVLKLSSHAARYLAERDYRAQVAVNWMGEVSRQETEATLQAFVLANPQKQTGTWNPHGLPSRLWHYLVLRSGLAAEKRWAEVGRKGLNHLVETLVNDVYALSGKGAYKEEFVTCGGIALSTVDWNTLESRVVPRLYFAGEVLDIDAVTGGFNLQAAWTTGFVAGTHMAD